MKKSILTTCPNFGGHHTYHRTKPLTLYFTFELEKVRTGVAIKIEDIYFDAGKWEIRPDAARELDKLAKFMVDNPTMEIEISSHTDCRGTIQYNRELSGKRAQSTVQYLASKGISLERMMAAGYGSSRLVNRCDCQDNSTACNEMQLQENRRTEFKILRF